MSFKTAIFDMDEVIVDTVPLHFKAWKKMFSEYGKDFDFDDYHEKVDGIPRFDGAKAVLTDLPDEEIRKACDKKQKYFIEFIESGEIPLYDSTVKLIKELKIQQIKVATISASKNCKRVLTAVGAIDLMDTIVDGYDVTKGKPDPQVFLIAAERLQSDPSECVVFEDAVLGVEAAKRANMVCIGVDRYNDPKRLAKADKVVSDLSEVNYKQLKGMFK